MYRITIHPTVKGRRARSAGASRDWLYLPALNNPADKSWSDECPSPAAVCAARCVTRSPPRRPTSCGNAGAICANISAPAAARSTRCSTRTLFHVSGETRVFASIADSGAAMRRSFCPSCGTPLFSEAKIAAAGDHRPRRYVGRSQSRQAGRNHLDQFGAPKWACFDPALPRARASPRRRSSDRRPTSRRPLNLPAILCKLRAFARREVNEEALAMSLSLYQSTVPVFERRAERLLADPRQGGGPRGGA